MIDAFGGYRKKAKTTTNIKDKRQAYVALRIFSWSFELTRAGPGPASANSSVVTTTKYSIEGLRSICRYVSWNPVLLPSFKELVTGVWMLHFKLNRWVALFLQCICTVRLKNRTDHYSTVEMYGEGKADFIYINKTLKVILFIYHRQLRNVHFRIVS